MIYKQIKKHTHQIACFFVSSSPPCCEPQINTARTIKNPRESNQTTDTLYYMYHTSTTSATFREKKKKTPCNTPVRVSVQTSATNIRTRCVCIRTCGCPLLTATVTANGHRQVYDTARATGSSEKNKNVTKTHDEIQRQDSSTSRAP